MNTYITPAISAIISDIDAELDWYYSPRNNGNVRAQNIEKALIILGRMRRFSAVIIVSRQQARHGYPVSPNAVYDRLQGCYIYSGPGAVQRAQELNNA